MAGEIPGLHHVTAIAGDPQRNLDFYTGVLGLRLVKFTVNFDDPAAYHLYYGDGAGRPGTLLTSFPWPGAPRGRQGNGMAIGVAFSVPDESLGYWMDRFAKRDVPFSPPVGRMGEELLPFSDPDGLSLELVAGSGIGSPAARWGGSVPPECAIRGLHGVTLSLERFERTAVLLRKTLGFHLAGADGEALRYETGPRGPGAVADVVCRPGASRGQVAVGTIHHVAWRAPGEAEQDRLRGEVAEAGHSVTPVIDRRYFRSVYFREPGGVLFEIATDLPGFAIDEPAERLGSSLMLPPALEPHRARIL